VSLKYNKTEWCKIFIRDHELCVCSCSVFAAEERKNSGMQCPSAWRYCRCIPCASELTYSVLSTNYFGLGGVRRIVMRMSMSVYVSLCPLATHLTPKLHDRTRSSADGIAICYLLLVHGWCHIFIPWCQWARIKHVLKKIARRQYQLYVRDLQNFAPGAQSDLLPYEKKSRLYLCLLLWLLSRDSFWWELFSSGEYRLTGVSEEMLN